MRRADWQSRLAEFARERLVMPFEWGRNDCCLFTVDAVWAMTGQDHAITFRGYDTALGAERLLKANGGVRGLATKAWGEPVPVAFAAVGDPVLMLNEGRELLAVCNGTSAISAGPDGVVALDMSAALAAWKI